jgi:hypothetical protein
MSGRAGPSVLVLCLIAIAVAIVTSVVVTFVQIAVAGQSNVAVTGGATGAVIFVLLRAMSRRASSRSQDPSGDSR